MKRIINKFIYLQIFTFVACLDNAVDKYPKAKKNKNEAKDAPIPK